MTRGAASPFSLAKPARNGAPASSILLTEVDFPAILSPALTPSQGWLSAIEKPRYNRPIWASRS